MVQFFKIHLFGLILFTGASAFAQDKCDIAYRDVTTACSIERQISPQASCDIAIKFCMDECSPKTSNYNDCFKRNPNSGSLTNSDGANKEIKITPSAPDAQSSGAPGMTLKPSLGLPSSLDGRDTRPDSYDNYMDGMSKGGVGIGVRGTVPLGGAPTTR